MNGISQPLLYAVDADGEPWPTFLIWLGHEDEDGTYADTDPPLPDGGAIFRFTERVVGGATMQTATKVYEQ